MRPECARMRRGCNYQLSIKPQYIKSKQFDVTKLKSSMFVTHLKEKKGKESAHPSLVELYDLLRANIRSVLETCLELIVGHRFSKYFHTVTRFDV